MKRNNHLIAGLCFTFLLIILSLSAAQEPENGNQLSFEEQFLKNPTADSFQAFMNENPLKAADYLAQNYNNEFAQQFYDNPEHLGLNPALDDKYISGEGSADVSTENIKRSLVVAATYFTQKFGKEVKIEKVPAGFFFDAKKNSLILGQSEYPVSTYTNILGVRVTGTEVILIPAETEEIGEISTTGGREGRLSYQEGGNLIFTDANGVEQKFSIVGNDPTRVNLHPDGTLEVEGPVKFITWLDSNNYAQVDNKFGTVIIKLNGDFKAENAEILTREIYVDGKAEKVGNLITAQDHGDRKLKDTDENGNQIKTRQNIDPDGRTVFVHRNSRVKVTTQGQTGENNVEIRIDELPSDSDAAKPEPATLEEAKELARNVRPPQGDLGNNAKVWIKKDESGISVVCKGKVDCGFSDVGPNGGISSIGKTEPHFIGHNGKSELNLKLGPQTVIALAGLLDYSDDQYSTAEGEKFGIQTVQDGASLKITRNEGSKEDFIYANCFDCKSDINAIRIQKTIVSGDPHLIPGVMKNHETDSITFVLRVDENGKLGYYPAQDRGLGKLAQAQTEGKTVEIGRGLDLQFPCGDKDCYVQLKEERGLGTKQVFYEEFDGKTTKTIPIDTGYGTVIGEARVLVSAKDEENLNKLLTLAKTNQLQAAAKLEFSNDPALRKLISQKLGIDITKLNNQGYLKTFEDSARYRLLVQEGFDRLREFGINPEDQEKLDAVLASRGIKPELAAAFDVYTKLLENEKREKLAGIEAVSKSCQGNPTACSFSQAQLRAEQEKAKKELVSIVNKREAAYREVKQREQTYLKNHPPEGAKNAEATAVQLGKDIKENQEAALRIESSLRGTQETPGAEARAAAAKQSYEQLLAEHKQKVEGQRLFAEQSIGFGEVPVVSSEEQESPEFKTARAEYFQKRELVNTLRKNLVNVQNQESSAKQELEDISSEFIGIQRDDVVANLYHAAGLHLEASEWAQESPYLSETSRRELLQSYEGYTEAQALERSEFLAGLGNDQSIAEAGAIQKALKERQPGIEATPQFRKAQDAHIKAVKARSEEKSQGLDEQSARHQKQTTERRKGIFSGEEDYRRPQDIVGAAFEFFSPPLALLRTAGVIPEDVNTVDYVYHVGGRILEKGHEPTYNYVFPALTSSYITPVAPVLDLLVASGVLEEGGVEALREYGAYSREKTEQEDRTAASLLEQQEHAQQRNQVLQVYADAGLSASEAFEAMKTGNYNPRVLQYNPQLEGRNIFESATSSLSVGEDIVLRELANGRLPEETETGREGLAYQALGKAENEEAIQGGKTAFVENEFREVSASHGGTAAAAEADRKVKLLDETTLGISERYHQTIVEPVGDGFASIENIVTLPLDAFEVVKIGRIALKVYRAEKQLLTAGKLIVHGTEEAKAALRLARVELRAAGASGDVAKVEKATERARTIYQNAVQAAQTAEQEAKITGRVADLGNQVKVSSYRQTLAAEYKQAEQRLAQAAGDLEDAQGLGDANKIETAQRTLADSQQRLTQLADLDEAAKVADARPAAEKIVGELPVSDKVRDAERGFEEAQDTFNRQHQALGPARVTEDVREQVRLANENLAAVRAEDLKNVPPEIASKRAQNDLAVEGLADSEYAASSRQKAAAEGKVVPIRQVEEQGVKTDVVNRNAVGCALYGLSGLDPCDFSQRAPVVKKATVPQQQIIASGSVPKSIDEIVELPPRVPGQDDWNDVVEVLETHPGVRLEESALETLTKKEHLLLGSGGEGVVLEIPEAARVHLPGVEKPAVIKVRNTDSGLEGAANSFPEQSKVLNRLAERGAAPRVYRAENTYYIAEKLEGKSLKDTILDRLSPEARVEYETYIARYKTSQSPAELQEARRVLTRAGYEGQLAEVQTAVEELTNALKAENVEIADFHWNNVIVITTPEGKLKAKLLDAGFANLGNPNTIERVYDQKLFDIMTGGGFEINPAEIKRLKTERAGTGISNIVNGCAISPNILVGSADACTIPTFPAFVEETVSAPISLERRVVDIPAPEISGVRLKTTTATAYTDPSVLQVAEKENWNNLVAIVKKNEQQSIIGTSDLEKLVKSPEYLGQGAEGIVRNIPEDVRLSLGIDKPSVIKIRHYEDPFGQYANTFSESANLLNSLKAKDVAPEAYKWGENYYIVEKLEGDTVNTFLHKYGSKDSDQVRKALDELTDALTESGVVVEDFHADNVFLVKTEKGLKAKVVDLGFAYTTDPASAKKIMDRKKAELFKGGGREVDLPNFRKIQRNQRQAAQNARGFSNDFPDEAESILISDPKKLELGLRRAGVKNEEIISYVLVPEGQRLSRIYEGGIDPLTVALKLGEGPTAKHLGGGVFERSGKKYNRATDGSWEQKGEWWRLGIDRKTNDPSIIGELDFAESNTFLSGSVSAAE